MKFTSLVIFTKACAICLMLEISFQANKFLIKEIMRTIAKNEMNRKLGKVYFASTGFQ